MRAIFVLLVWLQLATTMQPSVNLTATWLRPGIARIAWSQPASITLTCLYRKPVNNGATLVACWNNLPAGLVALTLPGVAPHDASMQPAVDDVYTLWVDGATAHATLRGLVLMPVWYG